MATTNSDHDHLKIIKSTFSFPEFAPECKISVHFIYLFLRYSQFQSPVTRLAMPILIMFTQKVFDQLSIYVNLYHQAKNQAILLICSGYMVD